MAKTETYSLKEIIQSFGVFYSAYTIYCLQSEQVLVLLQELMQVSGKLENEIILLTLNAVRYLRKSPTALTELEQEHGLTESP